MLSNLSTILSFAQYIRRIVIKLSSPSKGESSKSAFQERIIYIYLSNDQLIKLTFNLSNLLSSKQSIGRFVNNLCSYSIGK